MSSSNPAPIRLRPAIGTAIGTTAFFRNRILFDTLLSYLLASGQKEITVLFHACSIGAEVYSLLTQYLGSGLDTKFSLRCVATDKQSSFVDYAKAARFPPEIIQGCSEREQKFFVQQDGFITPVASTLARVEFLPAADFSTFSSNERFDVVCLLNALLYVDSDTQRRVIESISTYNNQWLVTTGFHADTIKADLQAVGYRPLLDNLQAIHDGWTDRLRAEPVATAQLPAHIFTDWSLRPFAEIADFEYKSCALFTKA